MEQERLFTKKNLMQTYWDIKNRFSLFRLTKWHLIFPLFIGYTITLFAYPKGFLSIGTIIFVTFYSLTIGVLSMKTYEFSEWHIEKYIPWLKYPVQRFFISIIIEIILGFVVLLAINYLFFMVIWGQNVDEFLHTTFNALKYLLVSTIGSILIINLISFFKNWRQSALNEEILKREILAAQYESLKNQINPHFLFNNLTALTSLVLTDQDKAVMFIQELSNTFRYVLESRECEVIELSKECGLIESIAHIYHLRHGNGLKINLNLSDIQNKYIVPIALQMLVENAVKHNIISASKPLIIDIFDDEDFIVVRNNYQPKSSKVLSNGVGLSNIQSRYQYQTNHKVIIEQTELFFIVKLPILRMPS